MADTLIVFAHPALERSRANCALLGAVADLGNVTVNDLYEQYPDFHIDVGREKRLLEAHRRIVWQHPFYWYSTPALLKEWFDVVLEYGWAYGRNGDALAGKSVLSVITTGGSAEAYCPEGHNRYTMTEFLRPLQQTAQLCGMRYEDPFIVHGALHLSDEALHATGRDYRNRLSGD